MVELGSGSEWTGSISIITPVFDRFWRADQNSRDGAGLGMTIANGIIEAHGGRIWVDSLIGRGTTFRFTVPCESGQPEGRYHGSWRAPGLARARSADHNS